MNATLIEELLGRPLTSVETTNADKYIEIAKERLEALLCFRLDVEESPGEEAEERVYDSRAGYRTLYVDPFTSVSEIKVDDTVTTDYKVKRWQSRGDWFNVIEFDDPMDCDEVKVTAVWGFETLPVTLGLLWAKMFDALSVENTLDSSVKSKSNEGFSVTYVGTPGYDQFILDNSSLINQWRQCEGVVSHGAVPTLHW